MCQTRAMCPLRHNSWAGWRKSILCVKTKMEKYSGVSDPSEIKKLLRWLAVGLERTIATDYINLFLTKRVSKFSARLRHLSLERIKGRK